MISVSGKKWEQKKINKNIVDKLRQEYDFSDILSRLIISRKFVNDEIATINTDLDLNNVFLNNEDFNQSIKLVVSCIKNNEKICILGDYDVDGSAATSLFVKFLESINHSFIYYIPDREKDGYGATKKLFQKLENDFSGWKFGIFTPFKDVQNYCSVKLKSHLFFHGGLHIHLYNA